MSNSKMCPFFKAKCYKEQCEFFDDVEDEILKKMGHEGTCSINNFIREDFDNIVYELSEIRQRIIDGIVVYEA